jgi:hypothetical protein
MTRSILWINSKNTVVRFWIACGACPSHDPEWRWRQRLLRRSLHQDPGAGMFAAPCALPNLSLAWNCGFAKISAQIAACST